MMEDSNNKKIEGEPLRDGLKRIIQESFLLKELQSKIKIVQRELPDASYELSKYGWYIDGESSPGQTIKLSQWLKDGEIDSVDQWFKKRYNRKRVKLIEKRLAQNYPNRERILKTAIKQHFKSDYVSSITILLTQVDGLFYDMTGKKYFSKHRSSEIKRFNIPELGLVDLLIEPLKKYTLINASENYLDDYSVKLNRHEVLHGVVTDFDTELNSLKIISFINFMDEMLSQAFKNER